MFELLSLALDPHALDARDGQWEALATFTYGHGLHGVELQLDGFGGDAFPRNPPRGLVCGVSLPVQMGWLDIWRNRPDAVKRYFAGDDAWAQRLAGGIWRSQIIRRLCDQLWAVKAMRAAYATVHAAHVEIAHTFTRAYTYTHLEVLDAFASVLNTVAALCGGEPPVHLYIDNTWWPGLTFADPTMVEYFMRCLEFDDWSFALDTAHLINTRPGLSDERDAIFYVLDRIEALSAEARERIECVRLSLSLSGAYQQASLEAGLPEGFAALSIAEQIALAREHIAHLDQHRPFTLYDCQRITDALQPLVVVHELAAASVSALSRALQTQYRALHHLPRTEGGS